MTDSEKNPALRSFVLWARQSRVLFPSLVVLIIAISLWAGTARRYLSFENPRIDIVKLQTTDVDYHMLYPSIEAKHTIGDTFNWWHEAWRADQWVGAYWRPLTMQAWWIEAHVFGEDRSYNWMRVSLVLSVLFDLLLLLFLWTLTKRRIVALGGLALFALPGLWIRAISPLSTTPRVWNADLLITQGWKDQPDLFANILVLGALIFALRSRYALCLLCAALAICFKESGLMAFPLIAILVVATGGIKKVPVWFYGGTVVVLGLMMFCRWLAGPMVFHFHSYGRDVSGWTRYSNAMLPLGFSAFSSYGQTVFGLGIFGLAVWRPKSLVAWVLCLVGLLAVSSALVAWQEGLTIDVGFAQLLMLGALPVALLLLWLVVFTVLWKEKTFFVWAMILAACAFVAAIPFGMATQAAEHVLTLARALQAGYGACAVLSVASLAMNRLARRRSVSLSHAGLAKL